MIFTRNRKPETRNYLRGATLIELIIITLVLSVVATGGFMYYQRFIDRQLISNTGNLIVSHLQEAQNQAKNSEGNSRYGSRFSAQKMEFLLEDGNLKVTKMLEFPNSLFISQINLEEDEEIVLFEGRNAKPDNHGYIRLVSNYYYTDVVISASGEIERTDIVSRR